MKMADLVPANTGMLSSTVTTTHLSERPHHSLI